jgi:formylglycine-generating enzyme required for sulfatase activity
MIGKSINVVPGILSLAMLISGSMKTATLCFALWMVLAAQAQLPSRKMEKNWALLEENVYISQTEVSNQEYRAFLTATANMPEYAAALWDTSAWSRLLTYNAPFIQHYHRHPAYDDYPAVNMSQQGAALFCQWLTLQYNARPDRAFQQVIIRLPATEEITKAMGRGMGWEGAEQSSGSLPNEQFLNDKGQYTANFTIIRQDAIKQDALQPTSPSIDDNPYLRDPAIITAPVTSYRPDAWGIYNLQGNVAEWTTSANVAMGGSYATTGWYLLPGRELPREAVKGHPDTGFRYVIEVVKP